MFTISVCMIVKNEEESLARILKCAKRFADEIIVVDTGSTDNTINIAKTFTDKVYSFDWVNDFSKARNYSFSMATCDYQMWLDADDYITDSNIEKINQLKNSDTNVDVYMLKYVMGFERNSPSLTYHRERLVKRIRNYQWKGFVHEVITPSGRIEYSDIEIEHRKIKSNPPKRNLLIYENAIKNGTELTTRDLYYYGRELYYNHLYKKAITVLSKHLRAKDQFLPNNIGSHLIIAECHNSFKNHDKALRTLFSCIKEYPPNAEICCSIANTYEYLQKPKHAIFWNIAAINSPKQTEGFVYPEYQNLIPMLSLCKIYYALGNINEANKYHKTAKQLFPSHPSVMYNDKFFGKKN